MIEDFSGRNLMNKPLDKSQDGRVNASGKAISLGAFMTSAPTNHFSGTSISYLQLSNHVVVHALMI